MLRFKLYILLLVGVLLLSVAAWSARPRDPNTASQYDQEFLIDFTDVIGITHPEIFGGSQAPASDNTKPWGVLESVGIACVRAELHIEQFWRGLENVTLDAYRADLPANGGPGTGLSDPANWNRAALERAAREFGLTAARDRGMTLAAVLCYAPAWLTYSGTPQGVIRDESIWSDIIQKTLAYYRDRLGIRFRFVEVWSSPDLPTGLVLEGSPYEEPKAYYSELFLSTRRAVKKFDPAIKVGAFGCSSPRASAEFLETHLRKHYLDPPPDFVSFGLSDGFAQMGPVDIPVRAVLKEFDLTDTVGVLIGAFSGPTTLAQRVTDPQNSGHFGFRLIWSLGRQLLGAFYDPLAGPGGLVTDANEPAPIARVWKIAGVDLALAQTESELLRIREKPTPTDGLTAYERVHLLAAYNPDAENVFLLANTRNVDSRVLLHLKNLGENTLAQLTMYYAAPAFQKDLPMVDTMARLKDDPYGLSVVVPARGFIGGKIKIISRAQHAQ